MSYNIYMVFGDDWTEEEEPIIDALGAKLQGDEGEMIYNKEG